MSFVWLILIFVIIAIVSDKFGGRKRPRGSVRKRLPQMRLPPSMPQPWQQDGRGAGSSPIAFEIPELRGAPPVREKGGDVCREVDASIAAESEAHQSEQRDALRRRPREVIRRRQREASRRQEATCLMEERAAVSPAVREAEVRTQSLIPTLTPASMQQAVVLAEILGNPKALRRR